MDLEWREGSISQCWHHCHECPRVGHPAAASLPTPGTVRAGGEAEALGEGHALGQV